MNHTKYAAAALLSSVAVGAIPASAQTSNTPWVELEAMSVMAGVGGEGGDGQLHLPNLGTNCAYPFKVSGFGVGPMVGVAKVWASGPVTNLTQLEEFPGSYTSAQGGITLVAGAGGGTLKNNANKVSLDLAAKTAGLGIGISGNGMTVDMPIPPENAPRVYVLEFGFNKNWVNAESRKTLNDLMDAWKCRFVNIAVAGHADTKEYDEVNLSKLRADAVRDYLVGAGVVPSRVTAKIHTDLQVPTGEAVRLRANRVVVVTIL
jgi:outer membrane protein OmpA-like peptidoglycan-associated protein